MGPEQGLMDCARSVSLLHVGKGLTLFFWKEGGGWREKERVQETERHRDTETPERVREEQSETRTGS